MGNLTNIRIVYTPTARQYLIHLHPEIKRGLRLVIEELLENPFRGKSLCQELSGFRSHRFKRYRVIYEYDEQKKRVKILFAGPRSDVYQLFQDYLHAMGGSPNQGIDL